MPPELPALSGSPTLSDYHFELPPELIAQRPPEERTQARLLTLARSTGALADHHVSDLPALLRGDELLVFNDTRVVPARLRGHKDTGGRFELLALAPADAPGHFHALGRASKGFAPGQPLHLAGPIPTTLRVVAAPPEGDLLIAFPPTFSSLWALLDAHGEVPLPPYMTRPPAPADRDRYQTVFARAPGAVAAPTAGLHFTPELLNQITALGASTTFVTLHVGPGTFAPVKVDNLANHVMHSEHYVVSEAAAAAIAAAKAAHRPILAVGTTVVRTLEAVAAAHDGYVVPSSGDTRLFIREGFPFRIVDQLMTNFHLPASTLLMLVSAFAGRAPVLEAYRHAVAARYRFFSYGDGMLIR